MGQTDSVVAFLGRSLLRTVAVLVSVVVLLSVGGVGLLVGSYPSSSHAGGYLFAALAVAATGGLLLSVLVLLETAVDLVGFVRGDNE